MIKELTPDEKKQFNIESPQQETISEEIMEEKKDVLDLDNVLDKAEQSYVVEKKETDLSELEEDTETDTLDATIRNEETPATPVPQKKELISEATKNMEHIRTLHRDVAELKSTGDITIASQMLRDARKDEKETKEETSTQKQIKFFITLGIILVIIALGVILFISQWTKPTLDAIPTAGNVPSIVRADVQIPIDVTNAYHFKIKSMIASEIQKQETFKQLAHFYFGQASRSGGELLGTKDFFQALNITVPVKLLELLGSQFMFGTYTVQEPHPFLIVTVSSFGQARDTMLLWEGTMLRDFKDVFALTTEETQPEAFTAPFRDEILYNQNVRSLYVPMIETVINEFITPPPEIPAEETTDINREISDTPTDAPTQEPENETTPAPETPEDPAPQGEETPNTPQSTPEEIVTPEPATTILKQERIADGESRVLLYTFINEYTLLITTDPSVIPEIVKRYTNRQVYSQ